ncbi:MAG TPA: N-formylglutamate amidohydrolase [Ohtaekwangia sp.]|nr:N-formylglutamate amidohydrolase [Ohtaekwangia sp.]
MDPFRIIPPRAAAVPILVSVPHCGTAFPDELIGAYDASLIHRPDDTDWFVDQLYEFVGDMGITMVHATYSRWVIDLNRDPERKPLYSDGRIITDLCPATTFSGQPLYNDKREVVEAEEVARRLELYYYPYHHVIGQHLKALKERFGQALLWDCHSIRRRVPAIQRDNFPDLILGDADGTAAASSFVACAVNELQASRYTFSHNHPFKGGYITRHFGNPSQGIHALQLEMVKANYMGDDELSYSRPRAEEIREVLKKTLGRLIEKIIT